MGCLGALLGRFGALLGCFGALLGRLGPLEAVLGPGALLGCLGPLLGGPRVSCGLSRGPLSFWAVMGGILRTSLTILDVLTNERTLDRSWDDLVGHSDHLPGISGPLGTILGRHMGVILPDLEAILERKIAGPAPGTPICGRDTSPWAPGAWVATCVGNATHVWSIIDIKLTRLWLAKREARRSSGPRVTALDFAPGTVRSARRGCLRILAPRRWGGEPGLASRGGL